MMRVTAVLVLLFAFLSAPAVMASSEEFQLELPPASTNTSSSSSSSSSASSSSSSSASSSSASSSSSSAASSSSASSSTGAAGNKGLKKPIIYVDRFERERLHDPRAPIFGRVKDPKLKKVHISEHIFGGEVKWAKGHTEFGCPCAIRLPERFRYDVELRERKDPKAFRRFLRRLCPCMDKKRRHPKLPPRPVQFYPKPRKHTWRKDLKCCEARNHNERSGCCRRARRHEERRRLKQWNHKKVVHAHHLHLPLDREERHRRHRIEAEKKHVVEADVFHPRDLKHEHDQIIHFGRRERREFRRRHTGMVNTVDPVARKEERRFAEEKRKHEIFCCRSKKCCAFDPKKCCELPKVVPEYYPHRLSRRERRQRRFGCRSQCRSFHEREERRSCRQKCYVKEHVRPAFYPLKHKQIHEIRRREFLGKDPKFVYAGH